MANLTESSIWEAGIYQLETTDPVKGGADGISNAQAKQLANRTKYLNDNKAPLASPTFTGTPAAPTAAADTNTTQVATTEFVVGQAATTAPLMDGTAAVGASKKFARQDHVHPADTKAAPAGEVAFFAMSTAPAGWLKANGAAVSRTTYAALFAAIGTMFGSGDGSTTFNLPDLRGEFLRGYDDGRGVDASRVFGSLQDSTQIGPWIGRYTVSPNQLYIAIVNGDGDGASSSSWVSYTSSSSVGVTGNTYQKIRPRNVSLLACIKY